MEIKTFKKNVSDEIKKNFIYLLKIIISFKYLVKS